MKLIQLQTTSTCNGKCIICPYKDSWFDKNPGKMPDELFQKILNDVNDYDPEFSGVFCPYLCNEPFADKKIVERSAMIVEQLYKPQLEISTNLTMASNVQIDKLLKVYENNDWRGRMMISHHGTNKVTYERIMGLPYGKALGKMKYLVKKAGGRLPIWIHTAVASHDKNYTVSTEDGIYRYWMNFLIENDLPVNNIKIHPLYFHNRAGNVVVDDWKYDKVVRQIGPNNPFSCPRIYDNLHVLYTGEVVLCCCDYQKQTVMGDLSKQSIKEFFDSKSWKATVQMVKGEINSPEDFICKRCQWPGA